jgi:hypothetical protein
MRLVGKHRTTDGGGLCRFWRFRSQPLWLSFWAVRRADAALLKATHRRAGGGLPKSDPIPNMRSESLSALQGAADRAMCYALSSGCRYATPRLIPSAHDQLFREFGDEAVSAVLSTGGRTWRGFGSDRSPEDAGFSTWVSLGLAGWSRPASSPVSEKLRSVPASADGLVPF